MREYSQEQMDKAIEINFKAGQKYERKRILSNIRKITDDDLEYLFQAGELNEIKADLRRLCVKEKTK